MTPLTTLIGYLEQLLQPDAPFPDACPNGLQVPGPEEIATVVTGVSAHATLLERAAALDADLVLVHHGLFWKGDPQQITPILHRRLRLLYGHDMALAAYHLPLDAHPVHGNNALLADALGLTDRVPLAGIGCAGTLPGDGLDPEALGALLAEAVGGRQPLHLPGGPERIRGVGVITGAASDYALDAIDAGLDAFVTGEPAERAMAIAADGGIHVYAAGHHATETFGVRRLGELLADAFGVTHHWVDVPNPI